MSKSPNFMLCIISVFLVFHNGPSCCASVAENAFVLSKPHTFVDMFPEIAGILQKFPSCVLHVAVLTDTINYVADPNTPVVLDFYQLIGEEMRLFNSTDPPTGAIFKKWSSLLPRILRFNCFLHLLVINGDEDFLRGDRGFLPELFSQNRLLSGSLLQKNAKVLPEIFGILCTKPCSGREEAEGGLQPNPSIYRVLSEDMNHLPLVFLLYAVASEYSHGWLFCWYCGLRSFMIAFDCSLRSTCISNMMETYVKVINGGRNVQWTVYQDVFSFYEWVPPKQKVTYCPMTLNSTSTCLLGDLGAIALFLYETLNWTSVLALENDSYDLEFTHPALRPWSYFERKPIELFIAGHSQSFRVITSAGVAEEGGTFLAQFRKPLDRFGWICIFISVIAITFSLAGKNGRPLLHFGTALRVNLFALISVMLGKPAIVSTRAEASRAFGTVGSLLFMTWVFASFFLSSSYTGIFHSAQIVGSKCSSNYTEIASLLGFKLFFAYEKSMFSNSRCNSVEESMHMQEMLKSYNNYTEQTDYFWLSMCEESRVVQLEDTRNPCAFHGVMKHMPYSGVSVVPLVTKYRTLYDNLTATMRLFCVDSLDKIVGTELTKPRTAFLSPENHFETDWSHFKATMKSESGHKFAFSKHEDRFLQIPEYYEITSGMNEYHKKVVPRRMKALMSSGIYSLWRKWEGLRHMFQQRKPLSEQVLPLGFRNSGITNVFYLFITCVLLSLLAIVLEIIVMALHIRVCF